MNENNFKKFSIFMITVLSFSSNIILMYQANTNLVMNYRLIKTQFMKEQKFSRSTTKSFTYSVYSFSGVTNTIKSEICFKTSEL